MLGELLRLASAELGKRVVQSVSEASADEAKAAVRTLARSSVTGVSLVPGVGAFVIGVAVGAGLGVLFAPRSGRDSRRALGAALRRLRERRGLGRVPAEDAPAAHSPQQV